jgi:hypothetical protein
MPGSHWALAGALIVEAEAAITAAMSIFEIFITSP